jgi:predicted nucleic acid-binding protein
MGTGYLLDTNVIIDFCAERLPKQSYERLISIIDTAPQISIINKIELLSFSIIPDQIIIFTQSALIIPLTEEIVAATIDIRKKYKIKLPDAIIAASAMCNNFTLITRISRTLKRLKGSIS